MVVAPPPAGPVVAPAPLFAPGGGSGGGGGGGGSGGGGPTGLSVVGGALSFRSVSWDCESGTMEIVMGRDRAAGGPIVREGADMQPPDVTVLSQSGTTAARVTGVPSAPGSGTFAYEAPLPGDYDLLSLRAMLVNGRGVEAASETVRTGGLCAGEVVFVDAAAGGGGSSGAEPQPPQTPAGPRDGDSGDAADAADPEADPEAEAEPEPRAEPEPEPGLVRGGVPADAAGGDSQDPEPRAEPDPEPEPGAGDGDAAPAPHSAAPEHDRAAPPPGGPASEPAGDGPGGTSGTSGTGGGAAPAPGGGCLIATAAHGTELAPQVQALREVRDGTLLPSGPGAAFMRQFSTAYYAVSPAAADLLRDHEAARHAAALLLAPAIHAAGIAGMAEPGSDAQVAAYGIAALAALAGMYVAAPAAAACAALHLAARWRRRTAHLSTRAA